MDFNTQHEQVKKQIIENLPIDEVAVALIKGRFNVLEVTQNFDYCSIGHSFETVLLVGDKGLRVTIEGAKLR